MRVKNCRALQNPLTAAARLHCECQQNEKELFDEEPRSGGGQISARSLSSWLSGAGQFAAVLEQTLDALGTGRFGVDAQERLSAREADKQPAAILSVELVPI